MVTSTTNRSGDVGGTRHSLDAPTILVECCEQSVICRFQLVHCAFLTHATFVAMHEEWIEIRMPSQDGESSLIQHAICCISFSYGTSYCAFLGCLVDVRRKGNGDFQVFVTFPEQLVVTNLRHAFRVPVIEKSGLETILRTWQNQEFTVVARDITEEGIEIELPSGTDQGLTVGAPISIELKYRGEAVKRSAEVRRIIGKHLYSVAFVGGHDDQGQNQASRLRGIVLSLQQLWLRSRLV